MNHRFIRIPNTIGLMVLSLGCSLILAIIGKISGTAQEPVRRMIESKDTRKGTNDYNPGPDHIIQEGTTLILLGTSDDVITLRAREKITSHFWTPIHPVQRCCCTPSFLGVEQLRLRRDGDPAPCWTGASAPRRSYCL